MSPRREYAGIEEIKRLVEQKPPVRNRPPIPKTEQMRRKAEREKLRRRRQIIMNTAAVVIIALFIFAVPLIRAMPKAAHRFLKEPALRAAATTSFMDTT